MTEVLNKIKNTVKKDKKLLVLLVCGILGIVLIALSELSDNAVTKQDADNNKEQISVSYEAQLEERLCNIVSQVKGVGSVKVMIKTNGTEQSELAQNSSSNRGSDGDVKAENEYVIVGSHSDEQGVLLKKSFPEIQGVIIVCDGGDDIKIQNSIINAVSSLLGISKNNIAVLKMKYTEEKP